MMNIENKQNELRDPQAFQEQEGGSSTPSEALEEHRLTPEEIEQLKEQASKATENWNQMLRVAADFENFKKRAAREKQDISKYANESLLEKLIPVLDNFDSALAAANIPVFVISTFETDVLLVRFVDEDAAARALQTVASLARRPGEPARRASEGRDVTA